MPVTIPQGRLENSNFDTHREDFENSVSIFSRQSFLLPQMADPVNLAITVGAIMSATILNRFMGAPTPAIAPTPTETTPKGNANSSPAPDPIPKVDSETETWRKSCKEEEEKNAKMKEKLEEEKQARAEEARKALEERYVAANKLAVVKMELEMQKQIREMVEKQTPGTTSGRNTPPRCSPTTPSTEPAITASSINPCQPVSSVPAVVYMTAPGGQPSQLTTVPTVQPVSNQTAIVQYPMGIQPLPTVQPVSNQTATNSNNQRARANDWVIARAMLFSFALGLLLNPTPYSLEEILRQSLSVVTGGVMAYCIEMGVEYLMPPIEELRKEIKRIVVSAYRWKKHRPNPWLVLPREIFCLIMEFQPNPRVDRVMIPWISNRPAMHYATPEEAALFPGKICEACCIRYQYLYAYEAQDGEWGSDPKHKCIYRCARWKRWRERQLCEMELFEKQEEIGRLILIYNGMVNLSWITQQANRSFYMLPPAQQEILRKTVPTYPEWNQYDIFERILNCKTYAKMREIRQCETRISEMYLRNTMQNAEE